MTSSDTPLAARRRDRVLTAMAAAGLDVLVLGRQDDANYASGMHRLWTAGTRPFGAGCIVVRSTGRTHVLSTWDAGLPETMSADDLYPATWNPRIMTGYLSAIPGLATAERIGVDEVSPSFARAAARFAPIAEIVTADEMMTEARRIKFGDEVEMITAACAIAWAGVDAALAATDNNPVGAAIAAMATAGTTVPSSTPIVRADDDGTVIDLGILLDAYEGGVGGVFTDGNRRPTPALVNACTAGAGHAELSAAATGDWLVRGLGMGFERPVIDADHGITETLDAGMVLSVTDNRHRDVVAVTDGEPRILSARSDL